MTTQEALFEYTIRIADDTLILGHRLGEWCGHGPVLEQDMALTNIALDLIGQARSLYQYAAKIQGKGHTEDDLAYLRDVLQYKNLLLMELPNGNFGDTIVRQFFNDIFRFYYYQALTHSKDEFLAAFAAKSLKEVKYHRRFSSEWMKRLGDGTELSHQKMQAALDKFWAYTCELFEMDEVDKTMIDAGIGVDLLDIKKKWQDNVAEVVQEATLKLPESTWMHSGGRKGFHTEHLGHILSEMQYMQRAYPGVEW
ncbi:MAG TPA: phenylacetate-CoA oxygenase subunit PaaI [Phaeodactylibacter sp.]|nr:phenylacetate-CoA oxygenase subunit PaaI [Phaeodactylibacter sp.]